MSRYAMLLGAFVLAACSETAFEPAPVKVNPTPAYTINMPGNVVLCNGGVADFVSCYAIVDAQFKRLYERNNFLSRMGESEYTPTSNANNNLATVYNTPSMSVTEAIRHLDAFISDVSHALQRGTYSACSADQLVAYANYLRAKITAGSVDFSDAVNLDSQCNISPVASVTGTGSVTSGVTLTVNDPWHYSNDQYNPANQTFTYFRVELQTATGWVDVPGAYNTPAEQLGAATLTFNIAHTTPGTYTYAVYQCDVRTGVLCSAPVTVTVTIVDPAAGGGTGLCPHDNRNDKKDDVPHTKPPCEKDDKEAKDHTITRTNGS